jgi:hypothetical protein
MEGEQDISEVLSPANIATPTTATTMFMHTRASSQQAV